MCAKKANIAIFKCISNGIYLGLCSSLYWYLRLYLAAKEAFLKPCANLAALTRLSWSLWDFVPVFFNVRLSSKSPSENLHSHMRFVRLHSRAILPCVIHLALGVCRYLVAFKTCPDKCVQALCIAPLINTVFTSLSSINQENFSLQSSCVLTKWKEKRRGGKWTAVKNNQQNL